MKKVRRFLSLYGQTILSSGVILAVVVGLLGFQLGTIVPGFSLSELEFVESASTIDKIVANPVNAPMKLPMFVLQHFEQATALTTRAVGAVYGVLTILLFYFIMRHWHTRRTSLLAAFLFIVSSWFLQVSRLALPYILLAFGIIALITIAGILQNRHSARFLVLLSLIGLAVLLYVPGMIWFILAVAIWRFPQIRKNIQDVPIWQRFIGGVLFLLIIGPLLYAYGTDVQVLREGLALPSEITLLEWLRRILVLPIFVTAQGPFVPVFNLGRLPLLDVFSTILVVLGMYWYYFRMKLQRAQLFILLVIISSVLIAFNGPTFLPLLLPVVFIVAGAGLTLLLQQWFTVFPRNPIARALGVITIALVIGVTGSYHIKRYFVAWAGNPDTRSEFIYLLDD